MSEVSPDERSDFERSCLAVPNVYGWFTQQRASVCVFYVFSIILCIVNIRVSFPDIPACKVYRESAALLCVRIL